MTVRQITSPPKPSAKHQGWFYSYYNHKTAAGGECAVVFPPVLKQLIKPGFAFDDSCIKWSDELRASVLELDFDEQPEEPSLPPEDGWGDPDTIAPSANGHAMAAVLERAGTRPPATRKREATEQAIQGAQLPAGLMKIGLEVTHLYLMQYRLLSSIPESSRALIAQKLTACAAIPFYRSAGVSLTEEDIQAISMS
jgi:hypothetical protein